MAASCSCLVVGKASLLKQIGTCLAMEELWNLVLLLVQLNMELPPYPGQLLAIQRSERRKVFAEQRERKRKESSF